MSEPVAAYNATTESGIEFKYIKVSRNSAIILTGNDGVFQE